MTESKENANGPPVVELKISREHGLLLCFSGNWVAGSRLPPVEGLLDELPSSPSGQLRFDTTSMVRWDSRFVTWIMRLLEAVEEFGLPVCYEGLPTGVQGLISLARAVPERADAKRTDRSTGLLNSVGHQVYDALDQAGQLLSFLGEVSIALGRLLMGKARFPRSDFFLFIQQTGVSALPIVALISVLVGLILAFIGALQLTMFGAQIYVANLVAIGMVREMGAMMAAIIMAGRTGAAFSAQLGTMQVNEELDAFRTLGISPVEYLVLPRMLALVLMMPLLCIFADLLGILGGMAVGVTLFDISFMQYLEQTRASIDLTDIAVGMVKSLVFAVLIAVSGCLKGIQCGRSASAVGEATTSAVVMAIVAIVVSDAIMTLITNALGV